MDLQIRVAICIPYYKKLWELERLLNTVTAQTFKDYIVIVTDDSSDDDAKGLVSRLDDRFVYNRNTVRLGPTRNCNRAIGLGRDYNPEYIKVMHNDDYFSYDWSLEEYVAMLDGNPKAVFAFSDSKIDVNRGKKIFDAPSLEHETCSLMENRYSIVARNCIGAPSAVLARNVGIMMDENLMWLVDVDWYLKLLEFQNCFEFTSKPLVTTGEDGSRVTDACIKDAELTQKEFLYLYYKHSPMQDFSYLDKIIRQCAAYYRRENKYWHEDDYLAILRDVINDGKKICLFGNDEDEMGRAQELLQQKGIRINCCLSDTAERWEEKIAGHFCIVAANPAKEVRKMLAAKGINSLQYVEQYIQNFELALGEAKTDWCWW